MSERRLFILAICTAVQVFWALSAFAQVDTAWVRTYNGPGNSGDEPNDMAVDGSGNVYVTGWSSGGGMNYDFATIRYYPNGDTAWVRRYNGPANGFDQAWAVSLDGFGNAYIVGRVDGNGSGLDCATVKYNVDGDTIWTRTYDGPGNDDDLASDVTVDTSGNAYVAGYTTGIGTEKDYTTIKYHSNGDTAWVRRYNGPENSWDWATAVAVDGSGNVHVAGFCDAGEYWRDGDYTTIKYYPNGDTAWLRKYNGPADTADHASAIALDDSGNVYVAGSSHGIGTGLDYLTIKYNPYGDTVWVRRHDGPGNSSDVANEIAVDGSGNVYVTGCPATIKYYPNGDTAWVRRYNPLGDHPTSGMDIAIDDAGNVYITGIGYLDPTQSDIVTVKYDSSGATVWATAYAGEGNGDDYGYAIALDDLDNVYVTGRSRGNGTADDYATIKYWPNFGPTVVAPDSSEFFCEADTIRFTVTATDPDTDDTLTLSGPGIPVPIEGVSPLVANVQIHVNSGGNYDYVYTVVDTRNGTDIDTSTWSITFNSAPGFFSLLSPMDSSFVLPFVTLDWDNSTDPDPQDEVRYDLHVSTSFAFHPDSTIIYDSLFTSGHTDSLGVGSHFWKVKAYDSCEETWSSETWTFCVVSRGDCNADGIIDLGDVVYLISYLYKGGPSPNPLEAGDCNCDEIVELGDVVYLINYLYRGGDPPSCS